MQITELLKQYQHTIETYLDQWVPAETVYPERIHQAMRYSLFAGGKRIRPILCLAACEAVGGNPMEAMRAACALECVHTYSLIHDDLPGMDNDDYRRGKLTNHKVFGEGMAILAGDALLNYAFELLSSDEITDPRKTVRLLRELADASGTMGMIGGQVVDILSEHVKPTKELLHYIHSKKTGALLRASVRMGGIAGGCTDVQLEALTAYGEGLGMAFQITDDILDIIGDATKIGKPVGSDEKNEKATFPALYGLETSKQMAQEAMDKAIVALEQLGDSAEYLRMIADYLVKRDC